MAIIQPSPVCARHPCTGTMLIFFDRKEKKRKKTISRLQRKLGNQIHANITKGSTLTDT